MKISNFKTSTSPLLTHDASWLFCIYHICALCVHIWHLGIPKVDNFHVSSQTKQCPWIHYFNNHHYIKSFLDQSIMECINLKKSMYAPLCHHFMCCHWDPTRSQVVSSLLYYNPTNSTQSTIEMHFLKILILLSKFEIMPKNFMILII